MKITEVRDKKSIRRFLDVPLAIYKNDPNWIQPLDAQIEEIFDPVQNTFFQHGEAIRWILIDDDGNSLGRVAAFINKKKAFGFQQPTGGMGFFECINDREAAFLLFDTCTEWLKERKMEAMDGPINFGENDNYWGLLVEGFVPPVYGMQYNPPYYQEFFEQYGFKFYFEQVSNRLDLTVPFPERFWKIAEWISKKPDIHYEHFSFKNVNKYVDDFSYIYNTAWQFHENFTPISKESLHRTLNKAKFLMDEELIWFAYSKDEPVAFEILVPDFNQVFKYLHGKMNLWSKLKIVWLKRKNVMTRGRIVIMGVVPKYQKQGIESGMFWHMDKVMKKKPWYNEIQLSWVGDFNPKMRALHESVGGVFSTRHITYRKIFNDGIEYTRSTVIPMDTKEKFISGDATK